MSKRARERKAAMRRLRAKWKQRPPLALGDTVLSRLRADLEAAYRRAYENVPELRWSQRVYVPQLPMVSLIKAI